MTNVADDLSHPAEPVPANTNPSPLRIIALMITPVLTFSLGSIPSHLFRISTMPISSINPATIPKWSIVSELMMTSFPAGLDI